MKLEVGMYVRTEYGIAKYLGKAKYEGISGKIEETNIDEFDNLNEELWSGDVPNWVFECDIEDIVLKASHNIIDLIEVGDYVNGRCVGSEEHNGFIELEVYSYDDYGDDYLLSNKDIKTIVTKEQFEEMQYKLK